MPEATTAAGLAGALSALALAMFGVDYYSLLYAFVGAILALTQSETMSRRRAVVFVVLSTLAGAALGTAAIAFAGSASRAYLIVGCLVGGAGAQFIVGSAIRALVARIDKIGGQP